MPDRPIHAYLAFSAVAFGAETVPSEQVDAAFGMPTGKLRERAGIVSLAYAEGGETESSLGAKAAQAALRTAGLAAEQADWILAASETHHSVPSLAVQLHRAIGDQFTNGITIQPRRYDLVEYIDDNKQLFWRNGCPSCLGRQFRLLPNDFWNDV